MTGSCSEPPICLTALSRRVSWAYVIHQPAPVLAVVGTQSEAHLDELLAAASLELSVPDLGWLETGGGRAKG